MVLNWGWYCHQRTFGLSPLVGCYWHLTGKRRNTAVRPRRYRAALVTKDYSAQQPRNAEVELLCPKSYVLPNPLIHPHVSLFWKVLSSCRQPIFISGQLEKTE